MKRGVVIILLMVACCMQATAQQRKVIPLDSVKKGDYQPVPVYLGKSEVMGGVMSKQQFDSLIKQGLTSRDNTGAVYKVKGFMFGYKEPNLYEDEEGNLMIYTDYWGEYCVGDTLTTLISSTLFDRTKAGDTLFFDRIKIESPAGVEGQGAPITVYIK